jgi:hypothetical protein
MSSDFDFSQKGYSEKHLLMPKYYGVYALGVDCKEGGISSQYKYKGELQAEFFSNKKLIFKKTTTAIVSAQHAAGGLAKYRSLSLMNFDIPFQGEYEDDLSIKFTVLKVDTELKRLGARCELFSAMDARP